MLLLKEREHDAKEARAARSGGRYGKAADGGPLRCGCGVPCGDELRYALVCGQLYRRRAAGGRALRTRPRRARPCNGEYHAAQRRDRASAGAFGAAERPRCGRAHFSRPRRVHAGGKVRAALRAPYLHAAERRQLRMCALVVRFRCEARGPGKGSIFTGDPRNAGEDPARVGAGDLLPRRDVRKLFGALPAQQLHDGARQQPRRLRPTMPLSICADGREAPGRILPRF